MGIGEKSPGGRGLSATPAFLDELRLSLSRMGRGWGKRLDEVWWCRCGGRDNRLLHLSHCRLQIIRKKSTEACIKVARSGVGALCVIKRWCNVYGIL
jgi:hypothetical protein